MKQKAILTLVLLYLSTTIYPQSFFRSVADIDSFAYVTMDSKILVLKRDLSNNLVFKNSVPFLSNHKPDKYNSCLLYTSDAADERSSVDLGGRRIIKKKTSEKERVHSQIIK